MRSTLWHLQCPQCSPGLRRGLQGSLQHPECSPHPSQSPGGFLEVSVLPTLVLYPSTCNYPYTSRNQLVGVEGKGTHKTSAPGWALLQESTLSVVLHQDCWLRWHDKDHATAWRAFSASRTRKQTRAQSPHLKGTVLDFLSYCFLYHFWASLTLETVCSQAMRETAQAPLTSWLPQGHEEAALQLLLGNTGQPQTTKMMASPALVIGCISIRP